MKLIKTLRNLVLALVMVSPLIMKAQDIKIKDVKFPAGKTATTINSTVTGYETVDYMLKAKAGQTLSVKLKSNRGSNGFNILAPGSQDEAIFVSTSQGNSYTGQTTKDGYYKIRVYLMRVDARRKVKATYSLSVSIK